ncbi:hypothetical protein BDP27DRAFT_1431777 [Rhodocollybia butyracea]|uniref:Uncharacterized protein n=1 Tax=Rhodocollybia butyracea TaxID=206335 RepID=A0A9P5PAC5_9AGAR|nr:hypothetical protein BDP27DRAFT_1431777 [Rhodocollybia butyracea]
MSEQVNITAQGGERKFCLSEIRRMTQKELLEIAQAQPHLWPSNSVGSLKNRTVVKILEEVLLDKDSRYYTTAPMPLDTVVIKKRHGGQGASAANPSMDPHVPESVVAPNVTRTGAAGSSAGAIARTNNGSMWNPIQMPIPHQNQEILNTLFTVRLLDKREIPPAHTAVDIIVDPSHILQEQCPLGKLKVKTKEVVQLLEGTNTIKGFIKLSTPHHRIKTDYQLFLFSKPRVPLRETPVSVEYLFASDGIINVMVENGLIKKQVNNILNSLKRKHKEEDSLSDLENEGSSGSTSSTFGPDAASIPLHIARKRANLQKADAD